MGISQKDFLEGFPRNKQGEKRTSEMNSANDQFAVRITDEESRSNTKADTQQIPAAEYASYAGEVISSLACKVVRQATARRRRQERRGLRIQKELDRTEVRLQTPKSVLQTNQGFSCASWDIRKMQQQCPKIQ
ncbi:hypothetical protein K0M31_008307 [Melipona bicolor]|uniref:Uncharacterized protein n=1 Tax=Melipona bicolor TaxID=60889 RepID=A0AA40FQQ2_9HYME|nr:hypothetical protein K0M31_008307 [Melipona bicolor]